MHKLSILLKSTATKLNLPIQYSRLKTCPFGSKPYSVKGKNEGSVTYGSTIFPLTWYITNKSGTELLLSGATAEKTRYNFIYPLKFQQRGPSHESRTICWNL